MEVGAQSHYPAALTPETVPVPIWEDRMGHSACLDGIWRKPLAPTEVPTPVRRGRSRSLYGLPYPGPCNRSTRLLKPVSKITLYYFDWMLLRHRQDWMCFSATVYKFSLTREQIIRSCCSHSQNCIWQAWSSGTVFVLFAGDTDKIIIAQYQSQRRFCKHVYVGFTA